MTYERDDLTKLYDTFTMTSMLQKGIVRKVQSKEDGNTEILLEIESSYTCHITDKKVKSIQSCTINTDIFNNADKIDNWEIIEDNGSALDDELALHVKGTSTIHLNENVKSYSYSPSGRYKIILFEQGTDIKTSKRWIEIWHRHIRIFVKNVTDTHGSYYCDDLIGDISWSDNEQSVCFIAEEPDKDASDSIEKCRYKNDLGEKYTGRRRPCVVTIDLTSNTVRCLSDIADNISQAVFTKDPKKLLLVKFSSWPRTYGMYACTNRPTSLHTVNIDGSELKTVNSGFHSSICSRIFVDKAGQCEKLVHLSAQVGGPHMHTASLIIMDFLTDQPPVTLVERVDIPAGPNDFPGLYPAKVLARPWLFLSDGSTKLVLTTQWQFRKTIVLIDMCKKQDIYNLTPTPILASWTVLDIADDIILAAKSSVNSPAKLMIGKVKVLRKGGYSVNWKCVFSFKSSSEMDFCSTHPLIPSSSTNSFDKNYSNGSILDWVQNHLTADLVSIRSFDIENGSIEKKYRPLEALLVFTKQPPPFLPKDERIYGASGRPLIVCPHGGPHVAYSTEWSLLTSLLATLGFVLVYVNYTGSSGYGQKGISELIGRIGDLEVRQTYQVAEYFVQERKDLIDPQKVMVLGGSHGGLIGAWLSLLYPKFFKAVMLRNPVIDLISNLSVSDIPEWAYFEVGLDFDFFAPTFPSISEMTVMREASPSSSFCKANEICPTLQIVGDNDRRVPPTSNAIKWHQMLLSKSMSSKLYLLNGAGHSLEGVVAEKDNFNILTSFMLEQLSNHDSSAVDGKK